MKRALGTLCGLTLGIQLALAAEPAQVDIVAFEAGVPLAQVAVFVDDLGRGTTNDEGAAHLTLDPGKHVIVLRAGETELLRYELNVVEGESDELIVTIRPDGTAEVALESSHQGKVVGTAGPETPSGPPGTLAGRVVDSETKKPVIGARVFVSGTPVDARTNESGEYHITLSPGTYSVSVVAADYSTQTIDLIEVKSEQDSGKDIELTPSGLDLPEFIVLEPFIEGSLAAFVEEKRTTSAVADILGAEQISRAGDSDAAGALKRVTGLTLVDGKFVYVRGLGERYSSVLVNGAQVPSPDPTRRVVPLDLFPTDILQGVVIQKSFSPEMPGEFGGGTIQLRTKAFPESFLLRVQVGIGYLDGTTFEDGLRYAGGDDDPIGYDDGARKLPESVQAGLAELGQIVQETPFTPGFTPAEIETFGEDLSDVWNTSEKSLDPNYGAAGSIGDSREFWDGIRLGYLGSVRYAHQWDTNEEFRANYAASDEDTLVQTRGLNRTQTERAVDLSAYLNLGAQIGEDHRINLTSILLRQTTDETQIDEGFDDSPDQSSRFTTLEWEENQLKTYQLGGEHAFPKLWNLGFNWLYTTSDARRYAPNTRNYRYDQVSQTDTRYRYSSRPDNNQVTFGDLRDSADSLDAGFQLPVAIDDQSSVQFFGGISNLERDRDSVIRRFQFVGQETVGQDALFDPLEDILSDENIFPGGIELREVTRNTDTYVAEQTLDGYYLNADLNWRDLVRFNVGARQEKLDQSVTTFNIVNPEQIVSQSLLETDDILPSASATWWINQDSQLRAIYSETVSRPDFRELSDAPFTDPILDAQSIGNSNLVPTALKNYDLRYEYYFSPTEVASIAGFYKDLQQPIERTVQPSTGTLITYFNAEAAEIYGIELDVYKSLSFAGDWKASQKTLRTWLRKVPWDDIYLGFNYAYIESSIVLSPELSFQTSDDRPLQGQSPYVANFQLGYQDPGSKQEWTLLANRFGRRISQVGVNLAPDIYEEPVTQLDFVYARKLWDVWTLKLRLRNLLDPEVRFTQGVETTRELKKGREAVLTLEWRPDS
jgi:hypothetical protein